MEAKFAIRLINNLCRFSLLFLWKLAFWLYCDWFQRLINLCYHKNS